MAARSATPTFASLLKLAHSLADRSGEVIRPYFRKAISVDDKGANGQYDPVTAADKAAERAISAMILKAFPEHGVVGEELEGRDGKGRFQWVIDPIDGTRAFITGSPLWGTLIGLLDGSEPVLGLMDQPFTGERYWSGISTAHLRTAGGKARRLKTRSCSKIGDAIAMTTSPDLFAPGVEQAAFERVRTRARMVRYGGDCYAYCLLASGWVDAVVEAGLKPFDIVALIPIIERAGGRVTAWDGSPATSGGRIVACGDPRLHDKILKLLAG